MAINVSNASSSAIYIYIATAIYHGALQGQPFSWKLMAACHTQLQCYCNISYDVQCSSATHIINASINAICNYYNATAI